MKNWNSPSYILHPIAWKSNFIRNKMLPIVFWEPWSVPTDVVFWCFRNKVFFFFYLKSYQAVASCQMCVSKSARLPCSCPGSLRKWELKKDLTFPDKPVQGAGEAQSQGLTQNLGLLLLSSWTEPSRSSLCSLWRRNFCCCIAKSFLIYLFIAAWLRSHLCRAECWMYLVAGNNLCLRESFILI